MIVYRPINWKRLFMSMHGSTASSVSGKNINMTVHAINDHACIAFNL